MGDLAWEKIGSEVVFTSPWFVVRKDHFRLPNGQEYDWYVREQMDVVRIFCLTEEGSVIMQRQYRAGTGVVAYEMSSGYVDPADVSFEAAARRELLEETGYAPATMELVGSYALSEADSTGTMHVFVGRGAKRVAEQKLDASEGIDVLTVSIDDVRAMMRDGRILGIGQIGSIALALEYIKT